MGQGRDGVQFRLSVDHWYLLGLQGSACMVAGERKGGPALSGFRNLSALLPIKKAAPRMRVLVDLFLLVLTIGCLGFALYKSLR